MTWIRRSVRAVPAATLACVLAGCFASSSQHEALARRVTAIEQADAQRRQQLQEAIERATHEIQMLNEQLEQARNQTRNLADLGARVTPLEDQMRAMRGTLDEIRHTLDAAGQENTAARQQLSGQLTQLDQRMLNVERRTGLAPAVDPNSIPQAPADILARARQAFDAHDWNQARALANALLERAPQDALADDARLIIGRSYLQEGRNATAAQELNRLVTDFPTADTVPDALTDIAEAFVRLGLCTQATRTLRTIIERFGSTPQGTAARQRLEEVRRLPRATCTG